jgi:hypothetical protein
VQLAAASLSSSIRQCYAIATGDDHSVASNVRDYAHANRLPPRFQPCGVEWTELRVAARDAFLYSRSTDGRRSVEQSRIFVAGPTVPTFDRYILQRSTTAPCAIRLLHRAVRVLLPGLDIRDWPLDDWIDSVETRLYARQAVLATAAAAPNASGNDIVAALEGMASAPSSAHRASSVGAPVPASGSAVAAGSTHHDAVEAALTAQSYRDFVQRFGLCDLTSVAGRRSAIGEGFSTTCLITVRVLCHGERSVARRHSELGSLLELRSHLADYFNFRLCTGFFSPERGWTILNLRGWSLTGTDSPQPTFLDQFLRQDLVSMDWLGMVNSLRAAGACGSMILERLPADHFCVPSDILALADFGECLLKAIGVPSTLPPGQPGFTWRSWWTFYASHLEYARRLPAREKQLDWLDGAHVQAMAALQLMSSGLRSLIMCTESRDRQLGALLPYDCQPAEVLRRRQAGVELWQGYFRIYTNMAPGGYWDMRPEYDPLPLRSERHGAGQLMLASNLVARASKRHGPPASSSSAGAHVAKRRAPFADAAAPRPMDRGCLKRIRKANPPINGRGPCYFHFQPGERCPHGESCRFHHGS